jgi:hypothetical protein
VHAAFEGNAAVDVSRWMIIAVWEKYGTERGYGVLVFWTSGDEAHMTAGMHDGADLGSARMHVRQAVCKALEWRHASR